METHAHTVLVVEDEQVLLDVIKAKLEKSGFRVVSARAVSQARDYLSEMNDIDALWLDHYLLGDEDGLDLVMSLKAPGSHWQKLPIFVVSNTAGPDKVREYEKLGISKYYVKAQSRIDAIVDEVKKYMSHEVH